MCREVEKIATQERIIDACMEACMETRIGARMLGRMIGRIEVFLEAVLVVMERRNCSLEDAMEYLKVAEDERIVIRKILSN